jgi:hypothetical protein
MPTNPRRRLDRHRSILAIGLAIKAAHAGYRVAFATAADWVARLKSAHTAGRLPAELVKLRRIMLIVVDEVGYIRLVEYVPGATGPNGSKNSKRRTPITRLAGSRWRASRRSCPAEPAPMRLLKP